MAHVFLDGFENGVNLDANVVGVGTGAIVADTGREGVGLGLRNSAGAAQFRCSYTAGSDTQYGHYGVKFSDGGFGNTSVGYAFQIAADAATIIHLTVNFDNLGRAQLRRGNTTGTILQTSSVSLPNGYYWSVFEWKVTIHDTTGEFIFKWNGQEVLNFTGDTKNGGVSTRPDAILLPNHSSGPTIIDDVIVNDTTGAVNNSWVGECTIIGIRPAGNGANSGLLGSDGNSVDNYLLVDESPYNTTDYVGSATVGAKDTYDMTPVGKVGAVTGVKVSGYMSKSDSGAKIARTLIRSAGGTEVESSDIGLSTSWQLLSGPIRELDGDGTSWTVAKVDAHEFGFKVQA